MTMLCSCELVIRIPLFDNPIYGSGDFGDAGDSTSIDYTARASVP